MLFWHLGGTIAIFRYVFRDPAVDLRFLIVGALVPNIIDKPLSLVTHLAPRSIGHTLLTPTVVIIVVLLITRRGRRRRQLMAVGIGMLIHLVLDGMWTDPETLVWPFLGAFRRGGFTLDLSSPLTWIGELAGVAYLLYLGRKAQLTDAGRRREFLLTGRVRTGRLDEPQDGQ